VAGAESTTAFDLLQAFLDRLDGDRISYQVGRVRDWSVLVEVRLPRVIWEVEFFRDGHIEAERYAATEDIVELTGRDPAELVALLELDWEPPDRPASA
jgi:hypothetical protein